MVNLIYFKSALYTEEVHDLWMYLLHTLSDIHITKETANYILFAVNEDSAKHLRFLASDCDMGVVLKCETENPEEEFKSDFPDMFD